MNRIDGSRAGTSERLSAWQVVMLFLCVYVLIALLVETVYSLPEGARKILSRIDTAVCFVFIGDFFLQLVRSKDRRSYLKWGWIDLVSSIPYLTVFRWGRAARLIRLLRLMRGVRSSTLSVLNCRV